MFLEQTKGNHPRKGWIEVICGSMFSGKTEELIRRLKRAKIAKQNVEIFKPMVDKRYSEVNIVLYYNFHLQVLPLNTADWRQGTKKNTKYILNIFVGF